MAVTADDIKAGGELIIVIGGAIMALAYGIRRLYRMAHNVDSLIDLVKANDSTTKEVRDDVLAIKREVFANGGGSLRDAVHRIDERVHALEELGCKALRKGNCP